MKRLDITCWIIIFLVAVITACNTNSSKRDESTENSHSLEPQANASPVDKPLKGVIKLQLEKVMEISSSIVDKDKYVRFTDAVIRPDGYFYVGSMKRAKIYRFDNKGQFLGSFLKRGEGPGEYIPTYSAFEHFGETVWVLAARKAGRFSKDGVFREEVKYRTPIYSPTLLNENSVIGILKERVSSSDKEKKIEKKIIAEIDKKGKNVKTFIESQLSGGIFIKKGPSGNVINFYFSDPRVTRTLIYALSPDKERLYICETDKYKIYVKDMENKQVRVIHGVSKAGKLSEEDKDEFASFYRTFKDIVQKHIPETYCAVEKIHPLPGGYIAVRYRTGLTRFGFDIFDPEGRFYCQLEELEIPYDHRIYFHDGSLLAIVTEGDQDVYREYKIRNLQEIFADNSHREE